MRLPSAGLPGRSRARAPVATMMFFAVGFILCVSIAGLAGNLERLGLDHVDLLLIHWPNPQQDKYVQTFRTMLALREEGLVGARQGFGWFVAGAPVRQELDRLGTIEAQLEDEVYWCRVADVPYGQYGPAAVYPARG